MPVDITSTTYRNGLAQYLISKELYVPRLYIDSVGVLTGGAGISLVQSKIDAQGMRWVDSNYDGSLNAADPVWNELKVWTDADGDGQADAGETKTLSALGISSLNYAMGTFEQMGLLQQLASPDLQADTYGIKTHVVPEGIVVETSTGEISLLTTHIDDESLLEANRDGVSSYEDIETIISAADLRANDTLAGWLGQDLTVTGVSNFTHGTGYLDGNGFVHYRPEANCSGAKRNEMTKDLANDSLWRMAA